MNPSEPDSFNHRTEHLSTGRSYHFVDQIPHDYDPVITPTLLCVHGFPDFWYGWRHLIAPWVKVHGWRVVVPDMLGYGGTDKPASPEHYTTKSLSADLAALLDLTGVRTAIVLGHDWGALVAWRFAQWHPDRIHALVTYGDLAVPDLTPCVELTPPLINARLSTPFIPPHSIYHTLEQIVERMPIFGYQLYFNDQSSTREIEENLVTFMTLLYRRRGTNKNITSVGRLRSLLMENPTVDGLLLNEQELRYYLETFKAGGMNGPLNYYRTTKHRIDEEAAAQLATHIPASLPVLFLWGDRDPTCPQTRVERMHKVVPSLREVRIEGQGHWLMAESADVVAENVAKFVGGVTCPAKSRL